MSEEDIRNTTEQIEEDRGLFPDVPDKRETSRQLGIEDIQTFMPVDKVSREVAKGYDPDEDGIMRISAERRGSKDEIDILLTLKTISENGEMNGLHLSRPLESYDMRIYYTICSLILAGYRTMDYSLILQKAGYSSHPNAREIQQLEESLNRTRSIVISLDNSEEAAKYDYEKIVVYDTLFLNFERRKETRKRGRETREIHLLQEPLLMRFSSSRKQFALLPPNIFQVPLNKTKDQLDLEHCLIQRILAAKRKALSPRILWETLYNDTTADTKERKRSLKSRAIKTLEYYKETGFIQDFSFDTKAITLHTTGDKLPPDYRQINT